MENLINFLSDLTALTIKHKIIIGACGCCDSPYLYHLGGIPATKNIKANNLRFDDKVNKYRAIDCDEVHE